MRIWTIALLILSALPSCLVAQFSVQLTAPNEEVLQFEAMPVDLTIRNETGSAIKFGKYLPDANVKFEIRRSRDRFLKKRRDSLFVSGWSIASQKEGTRRVDMSRFFDVRPVGRYFVRTKIKWRGKEYRSQEAIIDVVNGMVLLTRDRELPESPAVVRTYSLRYWARGDTEMLFLCVYDAKEKRSYGVFELGRIVRVFKPRIEFDPLGNIRIMHLVARDVIAHTYFIATPTGVRFIDQALRNPKGEPVGSSANEPPFSAEGE